MAYGVAEGRAPRRGTSTEANEGRRKRLTLACAVALFPINFAGVILFAFLHDPAAAKAGFGVAGPLAAAGIAVALLIPQGFPTRLGVWALLLCLDALAASISIALGGLAYHATPMLFLSIIFASAYLDERDALIAFAIGAVSVLAIAALGPADPAAALVTSGPIGPATSYFSAFLAMGVGFCAASLIAVTARTAQERRLSETIRRAERAISEKSEFLATISHELRTPLNGVIGGAELLINRGDDDAGRAGGRAIASGGEQPRDDDGANPRCGRAGHAAGCERHDLRRSAARGRLPPDQVRRAFLRLLLQRAARLHAGHLPA